MSERDDGDTLKPFLWACAMALGLILLLFIPGLCRAQPSVTCQGGCKWIVNGAAGHWKLDAGLPPGVVKWEVESESGTRWTVSVPDLYLPPPDRTATTPMRLRMRVYSAAGAVSDWGPWSDVALGVPLGYDPDWDHNGFILPSDYSAFMRAAQEGWIWPGR